MSEKENKDLTFANLLKKGNQACKDTVCQVIAELYYEINKKIDPEDSTVSFLLMAHLMAIGQETNISAYKNWSLLVYGSKDVKQLSVASNFVDRCNVPGTAPKTTVSNVRNNIDEYFIEYFTFLINSYNQGPTEAISEYTSLILRNIILDGKTDDNSHFLFGKLQCHKEDSNIYTPDEAPFICFLWYRFFRVLKLDNYVTKENPELFEKEKENIKAFLSHYESILNSNVDISECPENPDETRKIIARLVCDTSRVNPASLINLMKEAARIFLHIVTLAYCETCRSEIKIKEEINIFSGGNQMTDAIQSNEQAVINIYQLFNNNSTLQTVYSYLMDDYIRMDKDSRAKPNIRKNVNDGAICTYLLFLEQLIPLLPQHYTTINKLFNTAIYTAYNNPAVQDLIFSSEHIFKAKELYFKYYQQTELYSKYGGIHTAEHEMLPIPLIEYDFLAASVANRFINSGQADIEFRWHCYAEHWGDFRIRKVKRYDDADKIVRLNAHENDADIFIKSKESECREAANAGQLFVIEEKTDTDNYRIAAFAILCVYIYTDEKTVTYGQTINQEIMKNHPEMSFAETSVLNTVYVADGESTENGKTSFRGFGLQRLITHMFIKMAESENKRQIVLTVSPKNEVSYNNLRAMKFAKIGEVEYKGGFKRDFCCRYLR